MTNLTDVPAARVIGLPVDEARKAFIVWRDAHADELRRSRDVSDDVAATMTAFRELQRLLFESGWMRLGWPEEVGGLGGSLRLRAIVSEELANADYPAPFSFGTQEVLGPAVAKFAPPELTAQFLPRLLSGDDVWCQGFSEPGAGSDLAALQVRAVDDGDAWVVTGEKIWTSWAQFADRCVLLARTGAPGSAHRGITAMLLDMDTPGIEVRPLVAMNGDSDFCSMYFDGVRVPKSRTLGNPGNGWAFAMNVLGNERGALAWQRQAWMAARLRDLVRDFPQSSPARIGEAYELIHALRLLSRRTLRRIVEGEALGPETSFDKLTMSTAEKFLFESALEAAPHHALLGSNAAQQGWRNDYLYSRASSIYGGAAEIQRNIIAERTLGLPRE